MLAQGFLDLFFDATPHLADFLQFIELSTKAALLKSEVIQEPLPLKPGILVKKSVILVKRKNGFTKTVPWTENPGKIRTGAF